MLESGGLDTQRMRIPIGEVYSFFLVVAAMLLVAIYLQGIFWVFVLFALIDGLATFLRIGILVTVSRLSFAFTFLVLTSVSFGVVSIILETLSLIAILDISFLLREIKHHTGSDLWRILVARLVSYVYTLVPAGIFSAGVLYLTSSAFSNGISSDIAITLLGVSSVTVFLIILFLARAFRVSKSEIDPSKPPGQTSESK
jgi:hypothetical protein